MENVRALIGERKGEKAQKVKKNEQRHICVLLTI